MGEIAELIAEGLICCCCQSGIAEDEYSNAVANHPRYCRDCGGNPQTNGATRIGKKPLPEAVVQECKKLGAQHGISVRQCNDWHYQIQHHQKGWLYNIYPSKHRICNDRKRGGPFLKVDFGWTLQDVVRAVINAAKAE